MKKILAPFSFVLLSLLSATPAQAAADGWINVFVSETAVPSGSRYDYTVQNKTDIAITAIELGRRSGCFGDPALDSSALGDAALFQNAAGFTRSVLLGEGGGSYIRWEGKSLEKRIAGFSVTAKAGQAALTSGFVCVHRADAKVYQYKAAVMKDSGTPQLHLTLNPATLEGDTLFHEVTATLAGSDDLDTAPTYQLLAIRSSRADFDLAKEVKDAAIGTDDRKFQILADKPGQFIVEYQISDAAGNKGFASATVTITASADRTAPTLTVVLSPNSIAADNKFATIAVTLTVKDNADRTPTVKLLSITSTAADFNLANDVKNAVMGSDDRSFQLLAKRTGNADRVYKVTYEAQDASKNKKTVTETVTIKAETKSLLQQLVDAVVDLVVSLLNKLLSLFK